MKKSILLLTFLLSNLLTSFAQTCSQLEIQDGAKSTLIINVYTCPLSSDKKFQKAKQELKDEMILAYNTDVLSGKIPATYPSSMDFNIKKTTLSDGAVDYSN